MKKLYGFCKKCKKETEHKFKSSFPKKKSEEYEHDEWFECVRCRHKIREGSEVEETLVYR